MKKRPAMARMPATTPTTIPAIAPPDSFEPEEAPSVVAAVLPIPDEAEGVDVVEAAEDVPVVEVVEEEEVDVAVSVVVITETLAALLLVETSILPKS
jgi:hypothetical protein